MQTVSIEPPRGGIFISSARNNSGSQNEFKYLTDLKNHKYFRHTLPILTDHPFERELISCHSAVLVKGSNIISVGLNKPKRHGLVASYAPHDRMTIHAEVDAILKARRKHDLRGSVLYVARVLKASTMLSLSKPCATCHKIINNYGIHHVFFTTYMEGIGYVNVKKHYSKTNWEKAIS